MIYKGQGELPHNLKDNWYTQDMEKIQDKSKIIEREFNRIWSLLRNGMALVYDGVYKEEEINFKKMRKELRELHKQLNKKVTELK